MYDLNATQHKKYKIIKVVKQMYAWNIGMAFPCKFIYTGKHRGQLQYKHFSMFFVYVNHYMIIFKHNDMI